MDALDLSQIDLNATERVIGTDTGTSVGAGIVTNAACATRGMTPLAQLSVADATQLLLDCIIAPKSMAILASFAYGNKCPSLQRIPFKRLHSSLSHVDFDRVLAHACRRRIQWSRCSVAVPSVSARAYRYGWRIGDADRIWTLLTVLLATSSDTTRMSARALTYVYRDLATGDITLSFATEDDARRIVAALTALCVAGSICVAGHPRSVNDHIPVPLTLAYEPYASVEERDTSMRDEDDEIGMVRVLHSALMPHTRSRSRSPRAHRRIDVDDVDFNVDAISPSSSLCRASRRWTDMMTEQWVERRALERRHAAARHTLVRTFD